MTISTLSPNIILILCISFFLICSIISVSGILYIIRNRIKDKKNKKLALKHASKLVSLHGIDGALSHYVTDVNKAMEQPKFDSIYYYNLINAINDLT